MRIRGVVGAAGVRSGRGRRPEVAGRSTETPRGPGKRRVPPWRSEARCGRQGGIWRPVSWVRHPRRLKPSLAPSHAPATGVWVEAVAGTRPPDLVRTPGVPKAAAGAEGGVAEGGCRPGRAAASPASAPRADPAFPPAAQAGSARLFFEHWPGSSAGAQPGLVGRFAHGLPERSARN